MILNMHIRNDYSNWGIEYKPKKRVTTLCGKMSVPKYCGIPGLTAQEPVANKEAGDYGWCLQCCGIYLLEVAAIREQVFAVDSVHLTNLYRLGIRATKDQLRAAGTPIVMSPN